MASVGLNIELIKPLPFKEIPIPEWFAQDEEKTGYWKNRMRIIFFDPKQVYENIGGLIDPYKRIQSNLNSEVMFPKRNDGICRCGCGQESKRMWATQNCSSFAYKIYFIIAYGTAEGRKFVETYYGKDCVNCGESGCDIDHIIPVKHGGGGCWLSNFVPLCKKCHKDKTKKDFKWKEYKPIEPTNQIILNF